MVNWLHDSVISYLCRNKEGRRTLNPCIEITVRRLYQGKEKDPLAMDPLEKVTLDGLETFTYISSLIFNEESEQLRLMLLNNIDVFI